MWKCLNRGVWETIDLGVNAFKSDTSNGTCLLSSLAKDFDGKSDESIKCKFQQCCQDKGGCSHEVVDSNRPRENHLQKNKSNRPAKIHGRAQASEILSREHRNLKVVEVTKGLDAIPKPFIFAAVKNISQNCSHLVHEVTHSCVERTISGKCEAACSCDRKLSPDFDQILESNLVKKRRYLFRNESSKPTTYWKLHSKPLNGDVNSSEESKRLQSSSELDIAGSQKHNLFYFFAKNTRLHDSRGVELEKIGSSPVKNEPHDVVHSNSHTKSNCVLKLPFLCYDIGRFKGLNSVSVGWLLNARNNFRSDDNGRTNGEGSGESEETKEEAWRGCHMHHSFLEAIGWSSAILLGWFLGHCRFRRILGELNRDNSIERKKKCCVIRSLSELLVTWRGDAVLPLKVLPTKTDDIHKESRKKEKGKLHGEGITLIVDPYDTQSPNLLAWLNDEDDAIFERHSPINHLKLLEKEGRISDENHLNWKSHDTEELHKNVIPLPWPEVSHENLVYGPITFEEAIMEAGKGLEEAQSEVLLTLALEKLDKGCSSSRNEPLPADLLQSAASLGSVAAAFNLGICYEKGVGGVVKNLPKAYQWYKQASEKGHVAATYNMAVFHANGLGGLHPNTYLANQLLLKASSLGLEEATNALHLISSMNNSEISHTDGRSSSSVRQDYLNLDIEASGYSVKNHMLKSRTSLVVKSKQGNKSVYGSSYGESSNDLSAVSRPSSYFEKLSQMSSLKFGEALINSIALNNSVDARRPLVEEVVSDNHLCIKNSCVDNVSVLAH